MRKKEHPKLKEYSSLIVIGVIMTIYVVAKTTEVNWTKVGVVIGVIALLGMMSVFLWLMFGDMIRTMFRKSKSSDPEDKGHVKYAIKGALVVSAIVFTLVFLVFVAPEMYWYNHPDEWQPSYGYDTRSEVQQGYATIQTGSYKSDDLNPPTKSSILGALFLTAALAIIVGAIAGLFLVKIGPGMPDALIVILVISTALFLFLAVNDFLNAIYTPADYGSGEAVTEQTDDESEQGDVEANDPRNNISLGNYTFFFPKDSTTTYEYSYIDQDTETVVLWDAYEVRMVRIEERDRSLEDEVEFRCPGAPIEYVECDGNENTIASIQIDFRYSDGTPQWRKDFYFAEDGYFYSILIFSWQEDMSEAEQIIMDGLEGNN